MVSAVWKLINPAGSPPYVKGTGPGGINILATVTELSLDGITVTLPTTGASASFPNQTNFYNPFTIQWQISFDGMSTWQDAGTSQNPIYVCLSNIWATSPSSSFVIPYRTVVHLACSNAGATNADQAVLKTWGLFSGPANVNGWDETTQNYSRPLYYYKPGTDFSQNPAESGLDPNNPNPSDGSTTLLQSANGSARCGVWAAFLMQTLQLNGVVCHAIAVYPVGQDPQETLLFYVDNWGLTDTSKPLPTTPNDNSQYTSANPYTVTGPYEMQLLPNPPGGQPSNYGAIKSIDGHKGQNSPTPSQKIWGDHAFVQYIDNNNNVTYYDPSYGVTYIGSANQPDVTGETHFQAQSLMCFGIPYQYYDANNHYLYNIYQPSTLNVVFVTLF